MRLTRPYLRRLAVPAVVLAAALPTAAALGPAHAAAPTAARSAGHSSSVSAADPSHDVWFLDDGFAKEHRHIDGSRAAGDITSIKVTHTTGAVNVRLAERNVPKPRKRSFDFFNPEFLIKTPAERFVIIVVSTAGVPAEGFLLTYDGDFVECDGLRAHVGYHSDRVRVSVPRTCLANPTWVRAKAATTYQFARSFERSYVDLAPGRSLKGKKKTPRAYAPAGSVTRSVALRMAPHHTPLATDLAALLRTLHFLR